MPLLRLLGVPRFVTGDDVLDLPQKQVLLLASYLAYKEDWCSRDELLHLFWPDESEKTARHNLSQYLYLANGQAWVTNLETERNRVRWLVDSDVKKFRDALGDGNWAEAAEHYSGQLLEGVKLETSPNYDDWLAQERENLQAAWRESVLNHTGTLREQGQPRLAAQQLQEILKQDNLAEDILQAYLRLASTEESQRGPALRAFEAFRESLERELGMTPLETTVELAKKLRAGRPSTERTQTEVSEPVPETTPASLPSYPTPFIGREPERADLASLLESADTRLVTLLGPGGTGKTRLAAQMAREQAGQFRDGAVFVPLAALADEALVDATALQALGLSTPPRQSAGQFLESYLKDKQMLMVFDNMEHLPDSVDLIVALLAACPDLFILTTSREALGLQAEQVYDLTGLSYPDAQADTPEAYDAVRLFVRSARRAHAAFILDGDNRDAVSELCKVLDGSPLGLELAAAWVRLLGVDEIVEELEQNLDLLVAERKDLPERHRSLRAVFEHSWQLLSPDEQRALTGLSVFRGGFMRDAAKDVADVSVRTLLNLVNKSLLQRTLAGRFERHVLVKQFAEEKLSKDTSDTLRARHAEHFLCLTEQAETAYRGPQERVWLERLAADHDNLLTVLEWSLTQGSVELGLKVAVALSRYWVVKGHYELGRFWLEQLRSRLPPNQEALRGEALCKEGNLRFWQGRLAEAAELCAESLRLAKDLGDKRGAADALRSLGVVELYRGNHVEARPLLEQSLALRRELGDRQGMASTLGSLGSAAKRLADYDEAEEFFRESLALSRELGDMRGVAVYLSNLGDLAGNQGDLPGSKALIEEGLSLYWEVKDRGGVARSLCSLGITEAMLDNNLAATTLFKESVEISRDLGDQHGVALGLYYIGVCAQALGDLHTAREHFLDSLAVSRVVGEQLLVAGCTANLGVLARDRGDREEASRLLAEGLVQLRDFGAKREVAAALADIAVLLAVTGRHEPAVTLLAAAEVLNERIGASFFAPQLVAAVRNWAGRLRETLGHETFGRAHDAGESLSQDEAVDLALAELDAVGLKATRERGREQLQKE